MTNKNNDTLKIYCTKKYSTISQKYKILIRAQLVGYKIIILLGVIILYLIIIIQIFSFFYYNNYLGDFVYQIKCIFYKFMIKPCNARAFNQYIYIKELYLGFLFLAFAFATANRIRHTMKLVWLAVANMHKAQAWLHATI